MGCKIVIIGGGSYHWTPVLVKDLFLMPGLAGSDLVLVDIDQQAAEHMRDLCGMINERIGCEWNIKTASQSEALKGADYVCVSISTGGFDAMHQDLAIPEQYGIFHSVGDTIGPAGISRSLRNIPVFIDIAREMEEHCPNAWMIHVTNPLTQLTRAVCRETSIKCIGLCHNFEGTMAFMADYLKCDRNELDSICVGVNHNTWLTKLNCRGKNVDFEDLSLKQYLEYHAGKQGHLFTNTTDDELERLADDNGGIPQYINFELYERFGFFPVGGCSHAAENFPYYLNSKESIKKHFVRCKGVLPGRFELQQRRKNNALEVLRGEKDLTEIVTFSRSHEQFADIINSLYTGVPCRVIGALPNKGQIGNLARDVVVETWVTASASGIYPIQSGDVPLSLTGMMQTIVEEQELTVEAAISGDRRKLLQAIAVSPMVQNKDDAEKLTDKIIALNSPFRDK